jgi:ATP-binding cassette subfamily B multidrug efflux pump
MPPLVREYLREYTAQPMLKEYRTVLPYLREYRAKYAAGALCLVVVDGAQVYMPQLLRRAVDLVSSGAFELRELLAVVASMLIVALAMSCGRFAWRYFIHGSSRRIEAAMRDKLFGRLMDLSAGYFQSNKTGDLMARATNDLGAVRQALGMGFVTLFDGLFMTTAILAIMFAQNPRVAIMTIAPLPVITALILLFGSMVGKRFQVVQELYSRLSEIAQETIAGIRVVKSFVKEERFASDFSEANDRYGKVSLSLVKVFGFFFPFIAFLSGLTTVILLLSGGRAVIENRMSAGDIVAMLAYLEKLVWPLMGAGFTVNMIQRGGASLKRVNEILDAVPEIASSPGSLAGVPAGSVEFRDLGITYAGASSPALTGVSFALPEGATLGILGRVGSGKSTLLKVLPRLVEPPPGTVLVGGIDVRDRDLGDLRRAFGFVPQDSFLFSDSVEANVRFGGPGISEERFRRVVSIAALDRDVALFPSGWATLVGEKGLTLSGGQKQRVAIARALAADPAVLVLDDALSAVDAETEKAILSALLEERRGKTNIIVSHRVSTLRNADIIAVLDGGKIAQRGSHAELLAEADGFYSEMARLQELEDTVLRQGPRPDGRGER